MTEKQNEELKEKPNVAQQIDRLERTVEKLKHHIARAEYCLTSGCMRCSGQCELDDHVWQTFIEDDYLSEDLPAKQEPPADSKDSAAK